MTTISTPTAISHAGCRQQLLAVDVRLCSSRFGVLLAAPGTVCPPPTARGEGLNFCRPLIPAPSHGPRSPPLPSAPQRLPRCHLVGQEVPAVQDCQLRQAGLLLVPEEPGGDRNPAQLHLCQGVTWSLVVIGTPSPTWREPHPCGLAWAGVGQRRVGARKYCGEGSEGVMDGEWGGGVWTGNDVVPWQCGSILFPASPAVPLPTHTALCQGDITSSDLVNFVLEAEKVDTIMHFAAQTHVGAWGRRGLCLVTWRVGHVDVCRGLHAGVSHALAIFLASTSAGSRA
jgi:hypothetical protein